MEKVTYNIIELWIIQSSCIIQCSWSRWQSPLSTSRTVSSFPETHTLSFLYSRSVRRVELHSPVFSEFCYQVLKVYSQVASVRNVLLLNSVPCIQTPCVFSSSEQRNSELFLLWGFWLMLWTSVKKFEMFDLVQTLVGSSGVILWQPQLYFLQWFYHHFLLSWDLGSSIPHNFLPEMKRHLIGILVCISLMSNNLSFFSCVHWLSMLLCRMFISGYSLPFSWVIFLFFCRIFYLRSTHLLKINWHFFFLNLWFALLNVLMLSEAQFLFLYIAFLRLSPGWPGIPKALYTEWAFSPPHFPEGTRRCSCLEQFSYWKITMCFFFQCILRNHS